MDKSYYSDMNIPPEMLGSYMALSPFSSHIAGSRATMYAGHLSQFQIPIKNDFPNLFTGAEYVIGGYEYNSCEVIADYEILSIVPKYDFFLKGRSILSENPLYTIVYKNLDNGEISYMSLQTYTKYTEGYGYENKFLNSEMLVPNNIIPKGTKLYTSSAHNGNEYSIGANVNVAFMTLTETIEDAFVVSKSLADKMEPAGIETVTIEMDTKKFPLNLFGDDVEYKIIPDIGECIRSDGVICAFKNVDEISILNDLKQENITRHNPLFDTCCYGKANAEIIDIDVKLDPTVKLSSYFDQIKMYYDSTLSYYKNIYQIYNKYKESFTISKKLNTLVTRAISYLYVDGEYIKGVGGRKKKRILVTDKDKSISLQVKITYKYKKHVTNGFKLSGRDGSKGVIASIWDDEHMPVDEDGIRADMVIDPASTFKRTIVSQVIEQEINRNSLHIVKNMKSILSTNERFDYVIDYLNHVNPKFTKIVTDRCVTEKDKYDYLNYVEQNGLKIEVMSAQNNINTELFKTLKKDYGFKSSRVSFNVKQQDESYKRYTTKDKICIGSKYIYLLYIVPEVSASNIGYMTHFGSPSNKSTKAGKLSYPIKQACVKYGEDEFRCLLSTIGPEFALRLRTLSGTSLKGLEFLIETILDADQPSNIPFVDISNKELLENDVILGIIHTIFNALGLDIRNMEANKKDFDFYQKAMLSQTP